MENTLLDRTSSLSNAEEGHDNSVINGDAKNSNFAAGHEDRIPDSENQPTQYREMQFIQFQDGKDLLKGLALFFGSLVIDVGLPLGIYYGMRNHTSVIVALFVSCIPPLLFVIGKFIYFRKVDVMGCLFVFGFILSGIFALATGDPRLVLLRDSSVTCITGLCFLVTLIPIRTKRIVILPLSFLIFAQMLGGTDRIEWVDENGVEYSLSKPDWMFTYVRWVRLYGYVSTTTWGALLLCEFIAKVIMIQSSLTIDQIVSVSSMYS
jgi:hypothetical protein